MDDDAQFKIQARLIFGHFFGAFRFVGIKLHHALLQAFVGKLGQIIVERHAVGRGEQQQKVFTQRKCEIAAFGDFHRILQSFGQVGETLRHLLRRGEILARSEFVRAFFVGQHPAAGNTHPRFVGAEVFLVEKLGRMGGDYGQIKLRRDLQAAGNRCFPLRAFGQALQFEVKRIGKPCRVFLRRRPRRFGVAVHQVCAHFAVMRARQADKAAVVALGQPCLPQLGMIDVAVFADIGSGNQLTQAQIAAVVFYNQHGAERFVGRGGVFNPYIRCGHRFDTGTAAGFVEFYQAEGVHQVAHAQCGQAV